MKSGSALILSLIFAVTLAGSALAAQQGDRVIIRGPAGAEQADVRVSQERYGPITRADTLWSIATQVRPHSSVSVQQVMSAIVQANPHAFLNNNPNAMETGFILRIPSLQEVQMINPEAARRHIELGEQLQQSSQRLQSNRNEAALTAAERNTVLSQTREEAQQALQSVRDNYAGEFAELRTQMARSIENTESVYVANEELRARIDAIADTLEDIQRNMVAESEFQAQVRALMEDQQELRLNQQAQQELAEERGLANQIMSNPLALILLAFVPALLLILIATMVLRRRDGGNPAIRPAGTDTPVSPVTDSSPLMGTTDNGADAVDDFELDEAMAEFDGLDDDDGDDLSALEDEMLVPEQDDESIQLDDDLYDDLDELDLSEFDELDEDLIESEPDNESEKESPQTESQTEMPFEEGDQALSQDDLDMLFAGGLDSQEDDKATVSEQPTAAVADAENSADDEKEEAIADEPSPAELFANDEDSLSGDELDDSVLSDTAENDSEVESEESVFAADPESLEAEDDFDFEKMIEDYSEDDIDMELDDDDIDSLLTKSDELFNETGILDDEPAKGSAESALDTDEIELADDEELAADVTEANELKAEDKLDFDDDKAEDLPATPDNNNEFLDIDDILEEAENEPEELEDIDDTESQESGRAVQEDTLAAQLDLARAYLEMEEVDEARETVIAVINQATGELLEEANELLARIDG